MTRSWSAVATLDRGSVVKSTDLRLKDGLAARSDLRGYVRSRA